MKIGVKYCGGCNPHYERKTAVEQLKRRFADKMFETAIMDNEYDGILLVCGCQRACIKDNKSWEGAKYVLLKCEKDFENIEIFKEAERWV